MSILDFALEVAGMPSDQVAELDKEIPALARIIELVKQAEPLLTQAKPHVDALVPLLAQAQPHLNALVPIIIKMYPMIQQAYPDIVSATPSAVDLITFIRSKM